MFFKYFSIDESNNNQIIFHYINKNSQQSKILMNPLFPFVFFFKKKRRMKVEMMMINIPMYNMYNYFQYKVH